MKDTVRIGAITELTVQRRLVELGYDLFLPIMPSKCDLVFMRGGSCFRVQCKTARVQDSRVIFSAYSTSRIRSTEGSKPKVKYTKEMIDYFATIWEGEVYLIPIEVVTVKEPNILNLKQYVI